MKRCTACERWKGSDEFYVSRMGRRGEPILYAACKACRPRRSGRHSSAAYQAKWRAKRRAELAADRKREHMPAEPFCAWLESLMERDGLNVTQLAEVVGMDPEAARRYVKRKRSSVTLAVVEAAIIREGSAMLDDVYPYERAA